MAEIMDPMDGHLDEDRIFGLAEGGLDASARAAAEAHLRGCAACRREVEAAAIYFRETAGLEPVKAPANFLANVRARLPRPSPLRAFLDNFMRPLRVIPMQVALLTILGLTAISSYLYQRGGLHKDAVGVISESPAETAPETMPEAVPETAEETAGEKPEPLAESWASASESVDPLKKAESDARVASAPGKSKGYASPHPRGAVAPSPKKSSPALLSLRKQAQPGQALSDQDEASASASGSRSDESMRESEAPIGLDRAAPPAPAARMEPAPAAEAKGASGDKAISRSKPMEKAPASLLLGNAGTIGSAEPPAFILRLASGKRIGDVVAGLKAMGADSLSAESDRTTGDSGGGTIDYVFQVPASMRKDIAPYLERYGKTEGAGLTQATGSASSRIRIRFLP